MNITGIQSQNFTAAKPSKALQALLDAAQKSTDGCVNLYQANTLYKKASHIIQKKCPESEISINLFQPHPFLAKFFKQLPLREDVFVDGKKIASLRVPSDGGKPIERIRNIASALKEHSIKQLMEKRR